MMEELFNIAMSNATGVVFGLLMYRMANTTIKDNTIAVNELVTELRRRKI